MIGTESRVPLSGDTTATYTPISITATTNGAAQTIHTDAGVSGQNDDIWLQATNNTTGTVRLTLLKCGTTEPAQAIYVDIPPAGAKPTRILDGLPITGGKSLKAFAATAGAISLDGWANRYQAQ